METSRHFDQLPTWFLGAQTGEPLLHLEDGAPMLAVGAGVVLPGGGERYRVVDTWISFDHHGRFDEGQHVCSNA